MRKLNTALFALAVFTFAQLGYAATIEYNIFINGSDPGSEPLPLEAGEHTLEVQGMVTDNDLAEGMPGGFIQASFDLLKDGDGVTFVEEQGPFGPLGVWASASNDAFANHNAGALDEDGNVIEETGSILPADWNTRFGEVGGNAWSFVASGPFEYDGSSETVVTLSSVPGVNLIASLDGTAVGSRSPGDAGDAVLGDMVTIVPIPEPSALLLAGLGIMGIALQRRRG